MSLGSQLVGRADEVATATAALDAARRGQGRLIVLTGEAGIGKSRLLEELVSAAEQGGMAVLRGRCVPDGGSLRPVSEALLRDWRGRPFPPYPPLRPFRAALSRLVPGWAPEHGSPAGADASLVLAEGVLELLTSGYPDHAGVLLAVEDLHWADPATLNLLDHLADGLRTSRILIAATARTDEPGTGALHGLLARPGVVSIPLQRLSATDTARVVRQRAGAPLPTEALAFVVGRAAGLPLLAEELFTGLVERRSLRAGADGWEGTEVLVTDVPPSLAALVAARLAALEAPDRDVLRTAAVSGDIQDWRLLAEACDRSETGVVAALRAGVGANLLSGGGPYLSWRHALTREAVLAGLLPPEVAQRQGRLAAALEARQDEDALVRAARLRAASGHPALAARAFVTLARRAEGHGELGEATRLLALAADLADPVAVAVDRVRVATASGRAGEALDTGEAALPLVMGAAHAELCLELAAAAVEMARWELALTYLERSGRADEPRARALRADALFGAGDVPGARTVAVAVIDAGPDPRTLCTALEVAGRCDRNTDLEAARGWFTRAAQVAAEGGLTVRRVRALHSVGTLELAYSQHAPTLLAARELAESAGMLGTVAGIDLMLGDVALVVSGPAAGAALAGAAADLAGRLGMIDLRETARLLGATCLAFGGEHAAAAALAGSDLTGVPADRDGHLHTIRAARPLLAHDLAGALRELDAAFAVLGAHAAGAPLPTWGLWALLRTVLDSNGAVARELLRRSPAARRGVNAAALLLAEAVTAGREGQADDADALLEKADRQLHDAPWWGRLLRLLVHEAALADGWGDPVAGLRADLPGFEAAGDRALARTCRDLLRRGGVTVRRGRGESAVPPALAARGVTSREMDVLELVAQGASNADVAARLHLSARTVEHHVARLLAKTAGKSRAELKDWLGQD